MGKDNSIGEMIHDARKQRNVSGKQLCRGICSEAALSNCFFSVAHMMEIYPVSLRKKLLEIFREHTELSKAGYWMSSLKTSW